MVYLNLLKGLNRLDIPYRTNDFRRARRHPEELACVVGKPHVLDKYDWENPILFGASAFPHPIDCANLFKEYPVERFLVPGPWKKKMCEPYYGKDRVSVWPVGIDTEEWRPRVPNSEKDERILLYDKVRWRHDYFESTFIGPIREKIEQENIEIDTLRYGSYRPPDLKEALRRCKAVVFLCEHETQGIAYQQMLASGVPIFAWDRGGYWQDPEYFPDRVRYRPVTSVPYWDERCGTKFEDLSAFNNHFAPFWKRVQAERFSPREYIAENLTLEKCARQYVDIAENVSRENTGLSTIS
jgi:glycosyltransferase involved in cell wall biosynthesis